MTHILAVGKETFAPLAEYSKPSIIIKPKRSISVNDTIIFEHENEQVSFNVKNVTDRPGLMKGYVLIEIEKIPTV